MYTESHIKNNLSLTKKFPEKGNFVGISVTVNEEGQAHHSGLIIGYNAVNYYFHYDKSNVFLKQVDLNLADGVYHKKLEIIDERLVASFLNHCKIIEKTATPKYGYFYGGSYYENGTYHSNQNTPQLMSCVGFCINVLTGFIEEKNYIEFCDWQPVTDKAEKWFDDFIIELEKKYSDIDVSQLKKEFRRIKPSELISSAYFNSLPIRKIQTDQVKPVLEDIFKLTVS